jgi:hypothetical protein
LENDDIHCPSFQIFVAEANNEYGANQSRLLRIRNLAVEKAVLLPRVETT